MLKVSSLSSIGDCVVFTMLRTDYVSCDFCIFSLLMNVNFLSHPLQIGCNSNSRVSTGNLPSGYFFSPRINSKCNATFIGTKTYDSYRIS